MTQGDIDAGRVVAIVGFAPLKPAELVIIRIQQKLGDEEWARRKRHEPTK